MSCDTNSPIKMHDLSFLVQSENYRLFSLVMIIRKIYYKCCSLNSPSNTTLSRKLSELFLLCSHSCPPRLRIPLVLRTRDIQIQAWVTFVTAPQK
jgi:hypothetical protein